MNIAGSKECIELLAKTRGISKAEAESIFKDVIEVIVKKCSEGGVAIKDAFTIKKKVLKGRTGTCGFNGKEWKTEDSYTLGITVGKKMKEELNSK